MKESERLKSELNKEENDIKAFGIGGKIIREEQSENFEENWLPKLMQISTVVHNKATGRYTFQISGYGVMDFYPKANNLLIRRLNKWIKPALKWMIKEFNLK